LAHGLPAISEMPGLNEYASSAFQLPDNRICAVFDNVPDFSALKEQIYFTCLKDRRFTKPQMMQATAAADFTYFANARPMIFNGKIWIYFNAFNEVSGEARFGRFAFDEGNPETPIQWLGTFENLAQQSRSWVYPSVTSSGKVLITYGVKNFATGNSELKFALSDDGRTFGQAVSYTENAQLVRFGEFKNGPWAFSFQVGTGKDMKAYVMLSPDQGKTFTSRIRISNSDNVHDTFLFARSDGDLDVYYLVWFEGKGFSLFRRKISRDGTLGKEQQLTSTAVAVEKPHALRLSSGKIFVTLSKISGTETAIATDVVFLTLMDDAE
jgi:hypothetical protein